MTKKTKAVFTAMGGVPVRWRVKYIRTYDRDGTVKAERSTFVYAATPNEAIQKARERIGVKDRLTDDPPQQTPMLWTDGELVDHAIFLHEHQAIAWQATFFGRRDVKARRFKNRIWKGGPGVEDFCYSVVIRSRERRSKESLRKEM